MINNKTYLPGLVLTVLSILLVANPVALRAEENKHEPEIQKFEKKDAATSVPLNGILFVGSSSIRGWNVDKFFPGLPVLNRGFGGSQVSDVLHYFDRIVVPYKPKTIVFYSGDNDISGGKTTETVVSDVKKFVALVHEKLPSAQILIIPPKPSIARWKLWPAMQEVGLAEQQLAEADDKITFIDIAPAMLSPDGKPRKELLKKDGLHMTDEGYVIWSDMVRPLLEKSDTN